MNANIKLLIVLSVFLIFFSFLPRFSFAATCFWSQVPCGPTLFYGWINCPESYVSGNTCYYGSYCSWPLFTGCCFNNADPNKPSCPSYCAYYAGKWYWNYNGSPSCSSNGWICNFSGYQCAPYGCCDAACSAPTGCGLSPNNAKCTPNTCSQTYYDYCSAKKLVEYDNDCLKDSTTVTDSCNNTCKSDCSCTNCTPNCGPPGTTTHCCKGVCGAECSTGETKSCTKSYTYKKCVGNCCQSVTENFNGTQSCQSDCTWGACVVSNPPSDQCSTNSQCGGCNPGATQSCTKSCTYKKCVGSSCSSVTEGISGTQTCSSSCTWGSCLATCPSNQCSSDSDCVTTCSDSCDGYKLKDYNSDCQKNSGNCGGGITRYTGGECSVCPLNNNSCSSKYSANTQTSKDCFVPENMWSNEDFTIAHKVTFLGSATLTVKGDLILNSGGELTASSGSTIVFYIGKEIKLQGGKILMKGGYIIKK